MYNFIDTTESQSSVLLPSEALKFNGIYFENIISGYRTLYTRGREMLETEIAAEEVGVRDGAIYKNKRYKGRTIIVGFQLIKPTNTEFLEAFNRLNALLDVKESEMIFADEADKFYTGTKVGITDFEPGSNSITGEIEFYCSDPFKYSVEEYTVQTTDLSETLTDDTEEAESIDVSVPTFQVPYSGSHLGYPVITANIAADTGYIGFVDDRENIIQLGDPAEDEGENYRQNETLISDAFSTLNSRWTLNNALLSSTAWKQTGRAYIKSGTVRAASYGTGTGRHGPSITAAVPADSEGKTGAGNCRFEWKHRFQSTSTKQAGLFEAALLSGTTTKSRVAAMFLYKSRNSNKATCKLYVRGALKKTLRFYVHKSNKFTNTTASITKYGSKITFVIGGKKYSYRDTNLSSIAVTYTSFYFSKYAKYPGVYYCYVNSAKFIKNYVLKWRDVPNKFSAGDEVIIDCNDGSITLNGNPAPGLGALGNDWETFGLLPGTNNIGCVWSEWTAAPPTFELKYRKAWI